MQNCALFSYRARYDAISFSDCTKEFESIPNQGWFHVCSSSIKDGESGIYSINWRTDARDSPNLILERA